MSLNSIPFEIDGAFVLVGAVISLLASYRSFAIRAALTSRLYRHHALWTGIIGVYMVLIVIPLILYEVLGIGSIFVAPPPYSRSLELALTWFLYLGPALVVICAWFDRTIAVALDMDFFHRDALLWKHGLRIVFWATIISEFTVGVFVPGSGFLYWLFVVAFAVPLVYMGVVLAVSATRAKDRTFRNYTKWVGLIVATAVVLQFTYPYNSPFLVAAYFLYRAASSLSPTRKIEKEAE